MSSLIPGNLPLPGITPGVQQADFVAGDTGSEAVAIIWTTTLVQLTINGQTTMVPTPGPLNLTGITVNLLYAYGTETTQPATGRVTRNMVVTDATNGLASYQFQAGELEAGFLWMDVQVLDQAGNQVTSLAPQVALVRSAV